MTSERATPLHRAAAAAIFAALLAIAGWSLLAPLVEALSARDAIRARAARRELTASSAATGLIYDPAEIASAHADDAEAQLALQALLDQQARAALLIVESLQPAGEEALGEVGRVAWVEATLVGDLQAVVDFLAALDRDRPLVLVRAVDLEAGSGERPDASMRVRIEAGRAWRMGGAR